MRLRFASVMAAVCLAGPAVATAQAATGGAFEAGRVAPAADTVAGFLACLRDHGATMVTAHRGGVAGGLPENSLEAMKHTVAHIPTLLEVDVQVTRDGVLVLMHDDDVARTTDGHGDIQAMDWAEVRRLKLRNHAGLDTGAHVPTLAEVLEWARGRAVVQLDVKRGVPLEAVVAAVRDARAQSYASVIVYNRQDAATVARADPKISLNVNLFAMDQVDALAAMGVDLSRVAAFAGVGRPDPAYWAQLRRRGLSVGFGILWDGDLDIVTRGDDVRYAALADQGADILVTDRHFEAYRALSRRQDTPAAIAACSRP